MVQIRVNAETGTRLKSALILLTVTALLFVASVYTFGLLTSLNDVNTSDVLTELTLGVYSDNACTQNCTSIDWGSGYPGDYKTSRIYIKNLGTVDVTLSIQTTNWNPSIALPYFALTSNYTGQAIAPNEAVPITLTLSISPTIANIESFSFTILIVSEG